MPRTIDTGILTELNAAVVRCEYLFEAEFADQTLRLWSGSGDLTYDSKLWYGNGWFLGLDSIRETTKTQAEGATVTLTGVEPLIVTLALGASQRQYAGRIWLLFLDATEQPIQSDLRYVGKLDKVEILDEPTGGKVKLSYESELLRLRIPRERRYTSQDQKTDFPQDAGFDFVPSINNLRLYWGQPDTTRG